MTSEPRYRIGEIAEQLGVSTRTLRYYEELNLLAPSSYSTGGSRRYVEADRQRILRIRELQAIMGFNLEEIREILHADDRLAELSTEYRKGVTPKRQRAILVEAARLNARTQEQVLAKIAILQAFQAELEAKADRYREVAAELGIDISKETYAPKAQTCSTDQTQELPMTQHTGLTATASGTIEIGGDLTVNRLGFGAMRITGQGIWGEPADRDEAKAVLRRAVELGVNFIDTADSYGPT